jgi:hypothetical protein
MTVKTTIESLARRIGETISGDSSAPEIFDTLKQEHEEVAQMLQKLVESESGAERKKLVARIKAALLPHIQAEQSVLYDALIAIRDKKIQQDGQEGYIEHELAAATLAKLEAISNAMSPEFGAAGKVLKELIQHHVREEERNVWSDAKDRFSLDERVQMNSRYLVAKKLVGGSTGKASVAPRSRVAATPKKDTGHAKKVRGAVKRGAASKARPRSSVHPAV